jgi:hypothetical protein
VRQDYAAPATSYRSGPWPGITPRGAAVLLACAALLAALVESLNGLAALLPVALVTFLVRMPGAASAVTGAYLLPRALLSLLDPSVPLPPLLLVPAIAFDLAAWLRPSDLSAVRNAWPRRRNPWTVKRDRSSRRLTVQRIALATAAFAATLLVVEPAWQRFLAALS